MAHPTPNAMPVPDRLLVVMPSWVGDAAMAGPTLRTLRDLYPKAHIACLAKPYIRPVLDAMPWVDQIIVARQKRRGGGAVNRRRSGTALAFRLRSGRFDAAVLLANSLRTAMLVKLARIPRRIGYVRDGRGFLLTDRLLPLRGPQGYVPVSAVDYYLGLAYYLGARNADRRLELFTRPVDDRQADALLAGAGVDPAAERLVLINPGAANHADAKLWPAERFGKLSDHLVDRHGARVLINGGPAERAVLDRVHDAAKHDLVDLPRAGGTLRVLKSLMTKCDLVITNDTGARHIAAGMGTPTVSLFGPTDPRWAQLDFVGETMLRAGDTPALGAGKKNSRQMAHIPLDAVAAAADQAMDAAAQAS